MKRSFLFVLVFPLLLTWRCSDEEKEKSEPQPKVPVVRFISPQDDSFFEKGSKISFEIEASDEDGNILLVDLRIDGESVYYWETGPFVYNMETGDMEYGEYLVECYVDDDQGQSSMASVTITIIEPVVENYIVNGVLKSAATNSFLENIEVIFNELSSTTDAEGRFSFETNNVGIQTLHSEVSNDYIPVQYSWEFEENKTYDISLLAYSTVSGINTRNSDFIKGVSLFDGGPWMGQDLYPDAFMQTFDKIADMNANFVTFFDPLFVTVAGEDSVAMSTSANTNYAWDMLSQDQYKTLSDEASKRNLNMMYWFGVWPQDEEQLNGKSFNEIVFSGQKLSDAFWEDWFSEYARILKDYCQTAESKNIDWLSLGHGLSYATSPYAFSSEALYETLWSQLINEIRSVYTGKIAYFGITRPFTAFNYSGGSEWEFFEDDSYTNAFIDLFDAFGIVVSNVTEIENPTVSQVKSEMDRILNHYSDFRKPLILWVWAPSVDGAANTFGHLEPVLDVSYDANNWFVDFYEQADLYHGILQAVNESSVNIQGVISHGYMYYDQFTKYEPRNMNTAFEKAASVRGKPAEKIIQYWYDAFGN